MSEYSYGSGVSYPEWQRQKHLTGLISRELDASNRLLIASNEQLHRRGIEVQEQAIQLHRDSVDLQRETAKQHAGAMEQLRYRMQDVGAQLTNLNATFEWGFAGVLASLGGLKDSLNDLIRVAKTPAQTWAYEQFEIAREAFSKGLYQDALTYIQYAITGFGTYTGYRLEHRFHQLLGIIRLGSYDNTNDSIVSLPEAELAFREAAKYAERVLPGDAAIAMLSAGWCAYCQGEMERARSYTKKALEYRSDFGEAYFQLAKIEMNEGSVESALTPLREAIEHDPEYVLKAASDLDINKHDKIVSVFLVDLRSEAQRKATEDLAKAKAAISEAKARIVNNYLYAKPTCLNRVQQSYESAVIEFNSTTYFGFLEVSAMCGSILHETAEALLEAEFDHARTESSLAKDAFEQSRATENWLYEKQKNQEAEEVRAARDRESRASTVVWLCLGGVFCYGISTVIGTIKGLILLKEYRASSDKSGRTAVLIATMVGAPLGLFLIFALAVNTVTEVTHSGALGLVFGLVALATCVLAFVLCWKSLPKHEDKSDYRLQVLRVEQERQVCEERARVAANKLAEVEAARDAAAKKQIEAQFVATVAAYSPDKLRFEISKREKAISELRKDIRQEDLLHEQFLASHPDHMHSQAYAAHFRILEAIEAKLSAACSEKEYMESVLFH